MCWMSTVSDSFPDEFACMLREALDWARHGNCQLSKRDVDRAILVAEPSLLWRLSCYEKEHSRNSNILMKIYHFRILSTRGRRRGVRFAQGQVRKWCF